MNYFFLGLICIVSISRLTAQSTEKDTTLTKSLHQIVVTGTKTFKRKTESPVIVNILDSKALENLQVCNLAEGLKFQPGLRVETNCQTCSYTQLRMNGLQGGYSQILINGRPIFSPIVGLYGLEQLPVSMIERIEVVRGGGSSLYGSSAIGGTVNVITKLPKKNSLEVHSFYQSILGRANDININTNTNLVTKNKKLGTSIYMNMRRREDFDANQDNYSELPKLENQAIGFNSFYQINTNQKLELSLSYLHEYRIGGEMKKTAPHLLSQAEERKHHVWLASTDYQINFNRDHSSLIFYSAGSHTRRNHYTGVFPDSPIEVSDHLAFPPYGLSEATTFQGGFQLNHRVDSFLKSKNVFTLGLEYLYDKIEDEIPRYRYFVNQNTKDLGVFVQSDWDITPQLNLLTGVRWDKHNMVENGIWSPRIALLYKFKNNMQFRINYGRGFRAPQAFDSDLHIAFAGGGVSRVQLDPLLREEMSQSLSSSLNYDYVHSDFIAGFTLDAFYTHLDRAFTLVNTGNDSFGEIFAKKNGFGASVRGVTLELRGNYKKKAQLELGYTLQNSMFENEIEYAAGLVPVRNFLRTPHQYGFANLSLIPSKKWSIFLNYIYTGSMELLHLGGATNFENDAMVQTPSFSEFSSKVSYRIFFSKWMQELEIYSGIKNMFNAYQNDFDIGKNRDSNYIYGPSTPRIVYVGLRIKL